MRRRIGLVFQQQTLDLQLTAEQNLRFHADLYGLGRADAERRIDEVLEMVALADRRSDIVMKFSGGMKRRLEIARGLVHAPQVLFLDEPTIGLDPQTRAAIWDYLHDLRQRTEITVFVTTHYMDEAEHCDRIAIMDHGEIAVEDTPEALKSSIGTDRIALRTDDDELAIARDPRAARRRARRARGAGDDRRPRGSAGRPAAVHRARRAHPVGDRHPARASTTSS